MEGLTVPEVVEPSAYTDTEGSTYKTGRGEPLCFLLKTHTGREPGWK
jgi:hypothetical protein